jgi:hypothetical protein
MWAIMLSAAIRYFILIFLLGFVLGTVRTLVIAPRTGATAAVLIELPLMLTASWLVANRIVRHARFSPAQAFSMGALAFLLLMVAEMLLALALGNQDLGRWFADLFRTPGWIGLAGQIAFGLFPLLAALRLRPADTRA